VTLLYVLLAGMLSAIVVHFMMHRANHLGLVQHANERSSHTRCTPTSGGLGIAVGTIAGGMFACLGDLSLVLVLTLALIIALVGLVDDRWPLPAYLRLVVQFGALGLLIISSGAAFLIAGDSGGIGLALAAVALIVAGVWWVNLFNFMDGIDGFAASEALCMLIGAVGLTILRGGVLPTLPLFILMLGTGAATLSFLAFNWPPAKIFMGDVGSMFLGFLLFALAVLTAKSGWLSLWQWLILGGVFAADATTTLVQRLIGGKRAMQAHKSHAYQRLSRRWNGHQPVTLTLIAVNFLFIFPLSWAAGQWAPYAWAIAVCTYAVLGLCAYGLGAGKQG